jgi:hypothetical protein
MSKQELWSAVDTFSISLKSSSLIQELVSKLPGYHHRNSDEISEALMRLDAGTKLPSERPLHNFHWENALMQLPGFQMSPSVERFLQRSTIIGYSMEIIVSWVRSRLPMFPLIPVPQLASRASRTSEEIRYRMPWRKQMLQSGLQLQNDLPDQMLQRLEVADAGQLKAAISGLVDALQSSDEWINFKNLAQDLSPEDKQILKSAKTEVNLLLSERQVDAYEPGRVIRRGELRDETVRNVVESLCGRPRDFSDAFTEVDDLIDLCVIDLPGQIVSYGLPQCLDQAQEVEIEDASVTFAEVEVAAVRNVGGLVVLTDPLLKGDVLMLTRAQISFSASGNRNSYEGRRLRNSAQVWGLGSSDR